MTFSDRVRRRWVVSVVFGACGFALVELLVLVVLAFIVFVAVPLEDPALRRLFVTVVEVLVGLAYALAWSVRGMQSASIDTLLRDAGPLERDIIRARIVQENGRRES